MATAKTGAQLFAIFSLSPSLSFVGGMSYIGFTSDTWWPVDGDQYQPHAHMVGNRLLSAKVNYLVHLHWCAGGEYIHTYAQTVGCRMHIFTIIERVRFKVKWACVTVWDKDGARMASRLVCVLPGACPGWSYTFEVGTRNPTSPPVGSPLPVFSRI